MIPVKRMDELKKSGDSNGLWFENESSLYRITNNKNTTHIHI